ncbi:MAG: hypothetical protein JWP78_306 [Mucilaginibacter sp.]|nr:hypothetical protein [Mucilaginibacter sp.]
MGEIHNSYYYYYHKEFVLINGIWGAPATGGKFVGWTGLILFSAMLFFVLYGVSQSKTKIWFYLLAPLLLIFGILVAFLRWCFIP